jgi:hypothetical protein
MGILGGIKRGIETFVWEGWAVEAGLTKEEYKACCDAIDAERERDRRLREAEEDERSRKRDEDAAVEKAICDEKEILGLWREDD